MDGIKRLFIAVFLSITVFLVAGCNLFPFSLASTPTSMPTSTPYPTFTPPPTMTPTTIPTATPYPTYTPFPTATPYPTYTPFPTMPAPEPAGINEWVVGHYWSIKVEDVFVEEELDGKKPDEDVFVIVHVLWQGNDLDIKHIMYGADYELIDAEETQYRIVGMIYDAESYDSFGDDAEFQPGKWVWTQASGSASKTYRLVFDVPLSAEGLRLWFRDFDPIDLDLDL